MILFFTLQVVAIAVILAFLKLKLNRELKEFALMQMRADQWEKRSDPVAMADPRIINIEFITHQPLDHLEQIDILRELAKKYPVDCYPEFVVDRAIGGGMIIRTDDKVIDVSLVNRWRQMR